MWRPSRQSAIEPLTAVGRLLVRPAPALFLQTHEGESFDVRMDRNLPDNLALSQQLRLVQEAIPIRRPRHFVPQQRELVCLALPLLNKVSFKTFPKSLDDEADAIASLRTEIKQLVISAKQQDTTLEERCADAVKPAVDRLSRLQPSV